MWQILSTHLWLRFQIYPCSRLASTQKGMTSYASAHGDRMIVAISFLSADHFWEQVCKMTKIVWSMEQYGIYLDQKGKYYFPGKYGLAINMLWSALKSKQWMCTEFTAHSRAYFFLLKNISCYSCAISW